MGTLVQDLRITLRGLKKSVTFTFIVTLSIGLAIGANTTIFTWMESLILNPYPLVEDADRLIALNTTNPDGGASGAPPISWPEYLDWRGKATSFDGMVVYRPARFNFRNRDQQIGEPVWGQFVSGNYFDVLKVPVELGRAFLPDEERSAAPVAVISHNFWQRRLGGDRTIIGRRVTLNNTEITIIGVTAPRFVGTVVGLGFDLWIPATLQPMAPSEPNRLLNRGDRWLQGFARLKPGVPLAQARAEMEMLARQISAANGEVPPVGAAVRLMREQFLGSLLFALFSALLAGAGLVLLTACANVANLLLARAVSIGTNWRRRILDHVGGHSMNKSVFLLLLLFTLTANAQQPEPATIKGLERKLDQAMRQLDQLNEAMQSLRAEIAKLKGGQAISRDVQPPETAALQSSQSETARSEFAERIIEPEMGASERGETLRARPEIFIQSRYSALPIRDSNGEFEPNLSMTRIETRWGGKVSERIGAGLEVQFHPALDGSAEELVNDAFVEYYLDKHATLRVGQFIKPFGFDIQQSSAVRESPERGIFAGYFFPGQRDRGAMLFGDLNFTALKNVHYFIGAFNGNRFFADNNRQANYILRVRKLFDRPKLAVGFSAQRGKQILPPGVGGNNDENLIGMDFQYVIGRLGLRGEIVAGATPSTLLGIAPEFADAFRPGAKSAGGALFATWRLNGRDHIYARYDQFNRDPVKGYNVRAFNFGYLRYLGEMTRIGVDYQFKNRPSFNDDAVNGRFHITWSVEF